MNRLEGSHCRPLRGRDARPSGPTTERRRHPSILCVGRVNSGLDRRPSHPDRKGRTRDRRGVQPPRARPPIIMRRSVPRCRGHRIGRGQGTVSR